MSVNSVMAKPGKLSYLGIPRTHQLLDLTIGDLIKIAAKKYRNIPAIIVSGKKEFNYKELDEQTLMIGSGLAEIGLVKGSIVMTRAENSMELYLIRLACMRMGIIIVDAYPEISAIGFEYCAKIVGPHCIILGEETISGESYYDDALTFLPELKESSSSQSIKFEALPTLTTVLNFGRAFIPGTITFDSLYERGKDSSAVKRALEQETSVQFHDVCLIRFTSGTTGKPKVVSLQHHRLVNEASIVGDLNSYTSKDRICLGDSVCFSIMNAWGILPGLICGSTMVMVNGHQNVKNIIPTIAREKCTIFGSDCAVIREMMKDPLLSANPMNSLRRIFVVCEPTTPDFIQEIKDKFSVQFVANSYGMTEVGLVFHSLTSDSHLLQSATVGYPTQLIEVKLIDEMNRVVPIGDAGELCVRGACVVKGRFRAPDLDSDGWFHTGEMMVMLESGHCKVFGRMKDFISVEGHTVIPRQVEECLEKHPKIVEAQVFKVRKEGPIENVGAWIVLKPKERMTVEDVHGFCQNQLKPFEIPKYVHFVENIRRSFRGKVEKIKLEEKTKKLFEL